MNIELIKKYKAEFEHFLNEGKLLTRTKSDFIWNDEINENLMWNFEIQDIDIIINDEFSELRKALCDGKTVQAYYKFNDTWNDIIKPEFKNNVSNYRIKPEEPKFKIGDFVKFTDISNKHPQQIIKIEDEVAYTEFNKCLLTQLILWTPVKNEWCWFYDDKFKKSSHLAKFKQMSRQFFESEEIGIYDYCEPFLNCFPSYLKDK